MIKHNRANSQVNAHRIGQQSLKNTNLVAMCIFIEKMFNWKKAKCVEQLDLLVERKRH